MTYVICIPTYNRVKQLNEKTLKTLFNLGIKKELINVFVVKEEYKEYIKELNPEWYNNLIIGEKGLVQQREFIQKYYPENTKIISLDDDILEIDLSLTEYKTLDEFFEKAFEICKENKAYIWSVYPVYNQFFRISKKDITEDFTYCIGAFFGYINRYDDDLKINITREGNKEDIERSILYWLKDNRIIRFNKIGFKTKYYGVGGLGGLKERIPMMKKYTELLHEKYPLITKIKIRKNGLYEIVFKKQKLKPIEEIIIKQKDELNIVEKLEKIDPNREDIIEIYKMLENITIPLQSGKTGRARTFGVHRSMTLGMIKARVSRKYGLSYTTKKFPKIYESIKKFGETFVPFDFDAIHINKNVVCTRHLDPTNTGKSCLISIGNYEGCNLVVENVAEFNTNCQPIIFDGTNNYHFNTPLLNGTKYSFVFFPNKEKS